MYICVIYVNLQYISFISGGGLIVSYILSISRTEIQSSFDVIFLEFGVLTSSRSVSSLHSSDISSSSTTSIISSSLLADDSFISESLY